MDTEQDEEVDTKFLLICVKGTYLFDKTILFQSSDNFLTKFMQQYNFTKNQLINNKVKELE